MMNGNTADLVKKACFSSFAFDFAVLVVNLRHFQKL